PYHIVTPAMHNSKTDVAKLFNEKFGTPLNSTPEEITLLARKNLREKFMNADIGVSGANFLIAETGSICLSENEGNALMTVSWPKVHIAITGIEKILPRMKDLALFWPHLSIHGTGQALTVYNSIISGSRKANETDGPEKMYVILLDNGRSKLYENKTLQKALTCIRCGACLNVCPIYKNVGGYTYNTTYQGPIGTVISPAMKGLREWGHLSHACSLCGACSEICPVKIPLHEKILDIRSMLVQNKYTPLSERVAMKSLAKVLSQRTMLDFIGGWLKNLGASVFAKKMWGNKRTFPRFASKSFSKQYKKT
ncbi:MAG: LUD domain-containing protein, partial [Bacteroidales bacterium]